MPSAYKIEILKKIDNRISHEISLLLKQHITGAQEVSVKHLKKVIGSPLTYIFVAINKENKIVGMVTLVSFLNVAGIYKTWIEDVIVDVSHRRQGIGEALIKKALEKAQQLDIKTVNLTSRPGRIAANLLYRKLGFKIYNTNVFRFPLLKH